MTWCLSNPTLKSLVLGDARKSSSVENWIRANDAWHANQALTISLWPDSTTSLALSKSGFLIDRLAEGFRTLFKLALFWSPTGSQLRAGSGSASTPTFHPVLEAGIFQISHTLGDYEK